MASAPQNTPGHFQASHSGYGKNKSCVPGDLNHSKGQCPAPCHPLPCGPWGHPGEALAFTIHLAADEFEAQRAGAAAHHRVDADELGGDGRVEHVGLHGAIVHIPLENLQQPTVSRLRHSLCMRPLAQQTDLSIEWGRAPEQCMTLQQLHSLLCPCPTKPHIQQHPLHPSYSDTPQITTSREVARFFLFNTINRVRPCFLAFFSTAAETKSNFSVF